MIEYKKTHGDRHIFNETILNLQDLCLAFSSFFSECGFGFVISGCKVTSESNKFVVSEGFVWLDGKVRKVERASVKNISTIYIVPKKFEKTGHKYSVSGVTGSLYIDYYAEVSETPADICISTVDGSFPNLYNFFNKYALSKTSIPQTIECPVVFNNLKTRQKIIENTTLRLDSSGNIEILSDNKSGSKYKFIVNKYDGSVSVYNKSGQLLYCFGENKSQQIKLPHIITDSVNVNSINTNEANIDGIPVELIFLMKKPDLGWQKLTGSTGLYARQIVDKVYLTGELPAPSDAWVATSSNGKTVYSTGIKMPNGIASPPESMKFIMRTSGKAVRNASLNLFFNSNSVLCIESGSDLSLYPLSRSINLNYLL